MKESYDAVIVGSGPNGLAAAITLAKAGCSVLVIEARETIGGGTRTLELTLPGFRHDICSAIHPLAVGSPFFRRLPLREFGLEWIYPPASLAHPLPDGEVALLLGAVQDTAWELGRDRQAYTRLFGPRVVDWIHLLDDFLGPLPLPPHYPLAYAQLSLPSLRSGYGLAKSTFKSPLGQAFFAGMAAHSILPLERIISAGFGLMLGILGHAVGWPMARRGSQSIADALGAYLKTLGGKIETGWPVQSLEELPPSKAVLLDITPRQLLNMAGERLPTGYRFQLERYRYGPGVFKLDWALNAPIPWRQPECSQAATVHLGGTLEEITASEAAVWRGKLAERPFVILAQQSLFDPSRAPAGQHTAWAYCHVPNGSPVDMASRIEAQVERFAPGFRDCILARSVKSPQGMEAYNSNYIGGDINGGVQDLFQFFTRPVLQLNPYRTPLPGVYLCSSSTPPGGGVHGMCGYHAARTAIKDQFK